MTKITKRTIDALPVAGERQIIWDSELKGFGLIAVIGGGLLAGSLVLVALLALVAALLAFGLLAGTAIAAKGVRPSLRVIAVEPAGAGDAARSFQAGHIVPLDHAATIADGLRTTVGAPNFAIMQRHVDSVITVSEEAIVAAMRRIWETLKIVVEPSGAVPYAALLEGKLDVTGRRAGLILTGGNVDLDALPWG